MSKKFPSNQQRLPAGFISLPLKQPANFSLAEQSAELVGLAQLPTGAMQSPRNQLSVAAVTQPVQALAAGVRTLLRARQRDYKE